MKATVVSATSNTKRCPGWLRKGAWVVCFECRQVFLVAEVRTSLVLVFSPCHAPLVLSKLGETWDRAIISGTKMLNRQREGLPK